MSKSANQKKSFGDYLRIVQGDLWRHSGKQGKRALFSCLWRIPGFKYTFMMRTAAYLKQHKALLLPVYILARLLLQRYEYKFGISIPYNTPIGPGFYIGHFGGIVVSSKVRIGANCNINHGVTIGKSYGGKNPGTPTAGDQVYFGPGCKVFGGIFIGHHAAIGANSVVSADVPDNAVVVGIPGKVISYNGSGNYIVNIVPIE